MHLVGLLMNQNRLVLLFYVLSLLSAQRLVFILIVVLKYRVDWALTSVQALKLGMMR